MGAAMPPSDPKHMEKTILVLALVLSLVAAGFGYAAYNREASLAGRTADEWTVGKDLTVDTNTLKVDSTNNRVGVGTTTPTADLAVGNNNSTSTISVGKLCIITQDTAGKTIYMYLNDSAGGHSTGNLTFATSSKPCNI